MARLSPLGMSLLAAVVAAPLAHAADESVELRNSLTVDAGASQDPEKLLQMAEEMGCRQAIKFDSEFFRGFSCDMADGKDASLVFDKMARLAGPDNVWRVRSVPADPVPELEPNRTIEARQDEGPTLRHNVTQVDLLHQEGYTGENITIGIVDTGFDHEHPALGGCKGPNCRVLWAENVSGDGRGADEAVGCNPHGTMVAGVTVGSDTARGYIGAAPGAKLRVYRIQQCKQDGSAGDIREDSQLSGFIKAAEAKVDIIISSICTSVPWQHETGPLGRTLARISDSGIPLFISVGNGRTQGVFDVSEESSSRGVTGVASMENSIGQSAPRVVGYGATYTISGGEPTEFEFTRIKLGGEWWDDIESYEVVDLDAETAGFDRCNPGDPGRPDSDLQNHIVLVRMPPTTSGRYSLLERLENAQERGAVGIAAWNPNGGSVDWSESISTEGTRRSFGLMGVDSALHTAWATGLAAGQAVRVSITRSIDRIDDLPNTSRTSYGPTLNLAISPSVAAPGEPITVATSGSRYVVESGTSLSGPLVGGIAALMMQAHGRLSPARIQQMMMATAKPLYNRDISAGMNRYLDSVSGQGAGVIQARDALHTTTIIEPSGLAFNDSDHRPAAPLRLVINNTGTAEASYELSNVPAVTLFALKRNSIHPGRDDSQADDNGNEPVEAPADIRLSTSSLVLGPGQTATVEVSATDPQGIDRTRLPVWSGWIAINGSDDSRLTVPYLGLAGSLQRAAVIDATVRLDSSDEQSVPDNPVFVFPAPEGYTGPTVAASDGVRARPVGRFTILLGSAYASALLVPVPYCLPGMYDVPINRRRRRGAVIDTRGLGGRQAAPEWPCPPDSMLQAHIESPRINLGRCIYNAAWNGAYPDGSYPPPGQYVIAAQVLRVLGDPGSDAGWDYAETPNFTIAYTRD